MTNDLETIYNNLKNMYEAAKDAALVLRDLNIRNGNDISKEIEKYNQNIKDYDQKLETIDIAIRFIIQSVVIEIAKTKPIDTDDVLSKIKFTINTAPK